MLKNYDNFFLPADDLEKGREFYQAVLGLPVKFDFLNTVCLRLKLGMRNLLLFSGTILE